MRRHHEFRFKANCALRRDALECRLNNTYATYESFKHYYKCLALANKLIISTDVPEIANITLINHRRGICNVLIRER